MEIESWFNSFTPKTYEDIQCPASVEFLKWIDNFTNKCSIKGKRVDKGGNVIVYGNSGVGKHAMVNLCLEYKGISSPTSNWFIRGVTCTTGINIIIIDNLSKYSSLISKKALLDELKSNQSKYEKMYIIISHNRHSKFLNDIKTKCININMESPTSDMMLHTIDKICTHKNINLSSEDKNNVILNSTGDYRHMYDIMNSIIHSSSNIINKITTKVTDMTLFDITRQLLLKTNNIDDVLSKYDINKTLLPLMIDQYYVNTFKDKQSNIKNLVECSECIKISDIIDSYIYSNQQWSLYPLHGFFSCVLPSHILSKLKPDEKQECNYEFPIDLNMVSTRHIFKKTYNNVSLLFDMNVNDILYTHTLTKESSDFTAMLTTNGETKQIVDFIKRMK